MSAARKKAKKAGTRGPTGPRKTGRPCLLTPKRKQIILDGIRKGLTRRLAAMKAGVGESTVYEWMRTKPEFRQAIEDIEIEAAEKHLKNITDAGYGDWRASAWILQNRHREDFGKQVVEQRHTNADGSGPVEVQGRMSLDLTGLSPEQLRALAYPDEGDAEPAGETP